MLDRLSIKQIVIVEGKCDKNVLENVIDAIIIPVNGFSVYKDKKKLTLIRRYAEVDGAILLTDSDNAGRQIRNFLKGYLKDCEVEHLYVPNLYEVEDTDTQVLREAFVEFDNRCNEGITFYTRARLFDDGLIGSPNSAVRRKELLRLLDLPENLSVTALLDVLNRCNYDYEKIVGDGLAVPQKDI